MNSPHNIENHGFAILPGIFSARECDELLEEIERSTFKRTKAGVRHVMRQSAIATLACDARLLSIAEPILGETASPFRA